MLPLLSQAKAINERSGSQLKRYFVMTHARLRILTDCDKFFHVR